MPGQRRPIRLIFIVCAEAPSIAAPARAMATVTSAPSWMPPQTSGTEVMLKRASARKILKQAVIASCGRTSGLTIYAPGNFRPEQAGSTDALYLGLNFVRETEWGKFLRMVYPLVRKPAPGVEALPIPTPVSGLDRYNARQILAAVLSGEKESWIDRLRGEVLRPCRDVATEAVEQIDRIDPPLHLMKFRPGQKEEKRLHEQRRILVLPGIMGSLLHDRSGKLGAVWIDPWNLVFGDDFEGLKLKWETGKSVGERMKPGVEPVPLPARIPDADDAVQIEACGVIPLIYDRMALALMHEFGPIVEFAPYDWRQPIGYLGQGPCRPDRGPYQRLPCHPDCACGPLDGRARGHRCDEKTR